MKTTSSILFFLLLLAVSACDKQESTSVSTDIDIQDPVVTDTGNGAKMLDFTVVVTQFGNTFDREFKFTISRFGQSAVLDSFQTMLPSAREFVKFSVVVPGPGDYWTFVSTGTNGSGSGTLIKVQ